MITAISTKHIRASILFMLVQALALLLIQRFLPGITVLSLGSALLAALAYTVAQTAAWVLFIELLGRLPPLLYPLITSTLSAAAVVIAINFVPGVAIQGLTTGFWIVAIMTVVNSLAMGALSLDEDAVFDRNVVSRMARKYGKPTPTEETGFLYLEIDGLSAERLRDAVEGGHMPTVARWLASGSHTLTQWETDFSSQTGAMQAGILIGSNDEIPAFRWWDRAERRIRMSGDPRDARALEQQLSAGEGLLGRGGASRGNMFSGDAAESLLTMSTVLDRERPRGPGFYFFLLNPYIIARLITLYVGDVLKEWAQRWAQRWRRDRYIVRSRTMLYAFFRAFIGPVMHDLVTYMVISDVVRGVPAIYALYAGYDDLGHFAGIRSPEALASLRATDRYFARIERVLAEAPRPYHIIVLSDHGQSEGPTFEAAHGVSLEGLVTALIKEEGQVYAAQGTDEQWSKLKTFLSEAASDSAREGRRRAPLARRMRRARDDLLHVPQAEEDDAEARARELVTVSSGCAGLIYFTAAPVRLSLEAIQQRYPDLLLGLVAHPGIGFVLVHSTVNGPIVMGKGGIYFLNDDTHKGENPLLPYGPRAAHHLRRQSAFASCADIVVNTTYDPESEIICGFEDQVGHHGGLGGMQNHPFVLHPAALVSSEKPILGAEGLHDCLIRWQRGAGVPLEGAPRPHGSSIAEAGNTLG